MKTLRRQHNEIQSVRSENEVKLAEQKLFLGNLRERFRRDYQKELEDLAPLTDADAASDWTALETDVATKRSALDAIGPVNLEAITEYDELEQRHTFLTGQEADMLAAKDQILKAIQENETRSFTLSLEKKSKVLPSAPYGPNEIIEP